MIASRLAAASSLLPHWASTTLLIASILVFLGTWGVMVWALLLGPSTTSEMSAKLLWRVAPILAGIALVLGLSGIAGRFIEP